MQHLQFWVRVESSRLEHTLNLHVSLVYSNLIANAYLDLVKVERIA